MTARSYEERLKGIVCSSDRRRLVESVREKLRLSVEHDYGPHPG